MNKTAYPSPKLQSVQDLLLGIQDPSEDTGKISIRRVAHTDRRPLSYDSAYSKQAIELAVPPSTRSSKLYRFYHKLEEKLTNLSNNGFISQVRHSRSSGTTFTVKLPPANDGEFLKVLNNIPEVEKITDESKDGHDYPGLSHKFSIMLAN
jgi:hypothetical protein